ncbi:hypothetical protein P3G55_02085 [Leptospira sp. 96542]|nr:hypothetical protein [Leptospira sp. 96542]
MEVLFFFLFLISYFFLAGVCAYYAQILFFSAKSIYRREELTEIRSDVFRILLDILESGGSLTKSSILFFVSAILIWLWSLIGSILGDAGPGALEHIFHAPLFFLILFFSFPFIRDGLTNDPILREFKPVISGLILGNLAAATTHYGLDRDIFFLYLVFLFLIQFPILIFLWSREPIFGMVFEEKRGSWEEADDWGEPEPQETADEEDPFGDFR